MNASSYTRRQILKLGASLTAASFGVCSNLANLAETFAVDTPGAGQTNQLPTAKWNALPRWRGFNLCEKFSGQGAPYREDDFRNISDLGFNFVRLPMDYRSWIVDGDKLKFNEKTLEEIDQAVEFGKKYGIHVHLNFHRAPGYCVNPPKEEPSIWSNDDILDVCKLHWQTFAKRYRGISSDNLSFNLFNEPAGCTEEEYYHVVKTLVDGIRQEDPDRLVICDGLDWGTKPCLSLKDLKVGQATRGYSPMEISHWGASWVNSREFPDPHWPMVSFNALVPWQNKIGLSEELRKPLTLTGDFSDVSEIRFTVGVVSNSAELVMKIDGKETFRRKFVCGPGKGEWKEARYSEEYKIFANVYELEFSAPVPAGAKTIEFMTVDGDWLTLSKLTLVADNEEVVALGAADWQAKKQTLLNYERKNGKGILSGGQIRDRKWLYESNVKPWQEAQKAGIGVMVGEFGCFNQTPHHIALAWLEDCLANWRDAGWGWALWNFRGSFGVADSDRKDVDYEDWRGIKLDRKMLELLQRY